MPITYLYQAAYIYLALPVLIFLLGWLNWGVALVISFIFILGLYQVLVHNRENMTWQISSTTLYAAVVLAFLWCFFAGIGYFYYQSFDYHFRNAVFRDLINYDWPVMYDRADTPLVYYLTFWLPAAALAKFAALSISSPHTVFLIGNIYLYIYAVIGTILIFLLLAAAVKATGWRQTIATMLIFMFFSGLDIIGYSFFQIVKQPFAFHLDWWATFMQYSSLTTSMFWVFNQFIPTALVVLLIFNERKTENFGFLIAMLLLFAPYPTAGVGILMLFYAARKFLKTADKKLFIKNDILSVPNIIGVFFLLPIAVLYFITNSDGIDRLHYLFDFTTLGRFLLFITLEFMLLSAVLCRRYARDIWFQATLFSLIFIPFFRIDQQNNFCMRAAIPGLIILAVLTINFLLENLRERKNYILSALLTVLLLIGAVTPAFEF